MNIRNSMLVAASVLVLSSCTRHPGEAVRRGTLYNNEILDVDTEGFTFFKRVHQKAQFEASLAEYVQSSGASGEAKALAGKIADAYGPMVAELEALAGTF